MNAQNQAFSRSVSIDLDRLKVALTSSRIQYGLAQALMVAGYLVVTFNPLDGDAALLGLTCEAIALLLYVLSKKDKP